MNVRWGVLLLVSCSASAGREPSETLPPTFAGAGLTLDWEMRVEADQLRIDYTVKNATAARVTVVDALRFSHKPDLDRIIVRADRSPDAIAFTRAFVLPEAGDKPRFIPIPHYRDLVPGAELHGTAHARLPLGASRNYGSAHVITGARPNAVLELGYYDYPDVDETNFAHAPWATRPPKLLRAETRPLPPGVSLASPEEQIARSYGNVVGGPCVSPCPDERMTPSP
jgi:hypothetical protein